jgi:dTDP-4-dehydrorhamnose reductase
MKILITGAKGQLGQDCSQILASSFTVFPFGSQELDIADRRQMYDIMESIQPDIVINCAAYTAVDDCENNLKRCKQVNTDGPEYIAGACAKTGARMIHISTDYVYDGKKQPPKEYRENDPVSPLSVYGSSKLAGEEQVRRNTDNHLIIRTAWLYGIGGPNFLKTMLRLALSNPKRTIRVVNDQVGSLTWTYRLARQIKTLIESELTGTIHATAEGYCSWYDGAKHFLDAMGVPYSLEPCSTADFPTPAHRPANSILENRRLKKYRLNRMVPWQEDVTKFVERHRNELLAEAGRLP